MSVVPAAPQWPLQGPAGLSRTPSHPRWVGPPHAAIPSVGWTIPLVHPPPLLPRDHPRERGVHLRPRHAHAGQKKKLIYLFINKWHPPLFMDLLEFATIIN